MLAEVQNGESKVGNIFEILKYDFFQCVSFIVRIEKVWLGLGENHTIIFRISGQSKEQILR